MKKEPSSIGVFSLWCTSNKVHSDVITATMLWHKDKVTLKIAVKIVFSKCTCLFLSFFFLFDLDTTVTKRQSEGQNKGTNIGIIANVFLHNLMALFRRYDGIYITILHRFHSWMLFWDHRNNKNKILTHREWAQKVISFFVHTGLYCQQIKVSNKSCNFVP